MNASLELFVSISNSEISFITGQKNDQNIFEIFEKLTLSSDGLINNGITDLDRITNFIKKNILIIEQKVNYTFKDVNVILSDFNIYFLNLCGFKRLNGTQISKENITYILNSLKSNVDKFEKNKKILHIFNSEFCLDKKKLDNLPIGLFGDFYSHELSFNLINKNDHKNLENIFKRCNLKIKKILLESFIKGTLINDSDSKIETFFYIQIYKKESKIFYIENNSIKYEQKFDFGTDIILNDICKIISLSKNEVKNIIRDNKNIKKISKLDLLEEKYFKNVQYRKIKKKLIDEIADARINELRDLFYLKNINLKKSLNNVKNIILEIDDQQNINCFRGTYENSFSLNNMYEVKILEKILIDEIAKKASNIVHFGWKKEAVPFINPRKSLISRLFEQLFS